MADSLSPIDHTAIGAVAGSMEVLLMQPTIAIKNALQEGRPVPWSPKLLYRGLGVSGQLQKVVVPLTPGLALIGMYGLQVNLGSIAPITAIQVSGIPSCNKTSPDTSLVCTASVMRLCDNLHKLS